jgi:predicted MPP superfamily phosphohydrolase
MHTAGNSAFHDRRGLCTNQGFFPKYTKGIYRLADTEMVVSRGLGNSNFPLRLFNFPEVVVVDIMSQQ